MQFFNGFLAYVKEVSPRSDGESYDNVVPVTIPGDDVNLADLVRRMSRGEIVPLRQLPFGDATLDNADVVELEQEMRDRVSWDTSSDTSVTPDKTPDTSVTPDKTPDTSVTPDKSGD